MAIFKALPGEVFDRIRPMVSIIYLHHKNQWYNASSLQHEKANEPRVPLDHPCHHCSIVVAIMRKSAAIATDFSDGWSCDEVSTSLATSWTRIVIMNSSKDRWTRGKK